MFSAGMRSATPSGALPGCACCCAAWCLCAPASTLASGQCLWQAAHQTAECQAGQPCTVASPCLAAPASKHDHGAWSSSASNGGAVHSVLQGHLPESRTLSAPETGQAARALLRPRRPVRTTAAASRLSAGMLKLWEGEGEASAWRAMRVTVSERSVGDACSGLRARVDSRLGSSEGVTWRSARSGQP